MEDLKPVRVFLEVARLSSFSGAARSLGMTAASVTRIVAKLEQDLGQQLLVRTTRQVSLTGAGALIAARYRPVVAEFDQVTRDITQSYLPDRGRLRLNAPLSFGMRVLPGLIESFRLVYPRISLDVSLTDTLVDIIADECDLALRISGPPEDKSTIWRKVCEVPRRAVASPNLFERIPMPRTPADLDRAYCLSYSADGTPEHWHFAQGTLTRTVRAGDEVVSNNGDFLESLARMGAGITVLPDFIVEPGLADGSLVTVLPDWALSSLWLTLYYPPYEQLPPLVATFSEFFEAHIRELPSLSFA